MNWTPVDPPREFSVGRGKPITIRDCARIELAPDEQVTFVTPDGGEYDVTRKAWGFYATPSLNGRLPRFGLRARLVKNPEGRFFIVLVEEGREAEFDRYARDEDLTIVTDWDRESGGPE